MATVKNYLETFSGQPEQQKAAEDETAILVRLATYKLQTVETELRNKFLNRQLESQIELVGDKLGAFAQGYRVNFDTGSVGDAVKGIVNSIMAIGDTSAKELIAGAITNALDAMFSNVGAEEQEYTKFAVVFAGMALVRYGSTR